MEVRDRDLGRCVHENINLVVMCILVGLVHLVRPESIRLLFTNRLLSGNTLVVGGIVVKLRLVWCCIINLRLVGHREVGIAVRKASKKFLWRELLVCNCSNVHIVEEHTLGTRERTSIEHNSRRVLDPVDLEQAHAEEDQDDGHEHFTDEATLVTLVDVESFDEKSPDGLAEGAISDKIL